MSQLESEGSNSFEQVYGLRRGEAVRRVSPPFVEARMDFYRDLRPSQAELRPRGPDGMMIFWRDGKPQPWGMCFSGGKGYRAQDLIGNLLKTFPQDLEGEAELAQASITGDFAVDAAADVEQIRTALEKIISQATGSVVALTFRTVQRPVIVFGGEWVAKTPDRGPIDRTPLRIEIYGAKLSDPNTGGGGTGNCDELAKCIGRWIEKTTIIEASGTPAKVSWHYNRGDGGDGIADKQAHDMELVCKHIQDQTGMTWTEETRAVQRLFMERVK
jgi:hypothetical protein